MSDHFKYEIVEGGNWRRLEGTSAKGSNGARPHIVPVTNIAKSFAAMDALGAMGRTGLCPGQVRVGDDWFTAYRFVEITPEAAVDLITELEAEMLRTTVVEIC